MIGAGDETSSRVHQRIPLSVQVEYRTASSFLVAYSMNLSRGGIFLETDSALPVGSEVALEFTVPGSSEPVAVHGRVSWQRGVEDASGPPGMGVAFDEVAPALGALIDRLVTEFAGLTIVLVCPEPNGSAPLTRMIRSIVSTADVVTATEARIAESLVDDEVDLLVLQADADPEAALRVLTSRGSSPRVPAVVLSASGELRQRALEAGADEVVPHPPQFSDLQHRLVRAIGRPRGVKL